jgi:hypothetical protein
VSLSGAYKDILSNTSLLSLLATQPWTLFHINSLVFLGGVLVSGYFVDAVANLSCYHICRMIHVGKNTQSHVISNGISAGNSVHCYQELVQGCVWTSTVLQDKEK